MQKKEKEMRKYLIQIWENEKKKKKKKKKKVDMSIQEKIDLALRRGDLGKPHHWGVRVKWWGKESKGETSKKNHKNCLFGKIKRK